MAGYIGTQAVSVNTTSATISDDLSVGDDAAIGGTLGVTGITDFGSYQGSSVNSPVNIKSDSNHFTLSLEENSGTETWQLGVDADGDLNFHNSGGSTPTVVFKDDDTLEFNVTVMKYTGGDLQIQSNAQDHGLFLAGGNNSNDGANISLGGPSRSSLANVTRFRQDTVESMRISAAGAVQLAASATTSALIGRSVIPNGSNGLTLTASIVSTLPSTTPAIADNTSTGASLFLAGRSTDAYGGNIVLQAYGSGSATTGNQISFNNRSGAGTTKEVMNINSAGDVKVNVGNISFATAGKGINFHNFGTGTNIDNNLLDDYEEGTWSPTILQGSNAPAAYAKRTGYYTKVGNLVHLNGRVKLNGLGSMSGTIFMTGLPFTATNATNNFSAFHVGYYEGLALPTANTTIMGIVNPNSINVDLRIGNHVAAAPTLTAAHVSADGDFIFSMTYKA